uniref:Uncharacterized protein n=1 Tax=Rhizophora mucronata TaxID=61149 RepID=A0A2P2NTH3_RHIMU
MYQIENFNKSFKLCTTIKREKPLIT